MSKEIRVCSVYSPPKTKDGLWILVDRLWPRGLKKEALAFDLWPKDITPSTPLRQWFHVDPAGRWSEFVRDYVEELQKNASIIEEIQKKAKNEPITLFYAAKDTDRNHAIVLQAVLRSWPKMPDLVALD